MFEYIRQKDLNCAIDVLDINRKLNKFKKFC